MHRLPRSWVSLGILLAALTSRATAAGEPAAQSVASAAVGVASVWDEVVKQLPSLARARRLPAPTVMDATLTQAIAGSDLRVQLVSWNNRPLCGRAWVAGQDRMPRSVWVVEEKSADGGTWLRINVGVPGEFTPKGAPCDGCVFELTLTEAAGKVVGSYKTAGVETDSLPVPAATGSVAGTRRPTDGALSAPHLRAGNEIEVLPGAEALMRLYRAMDMAASQGVAPAEAWRAGRVVAPDCQPQKTVTTGKPALKLPSLDDPAAASAPTESSVVKEVKLLIARGALERMCVAAKEWTAALPAAKGADDTSADPDFGPWYGHGCLTSNASYRLNNSLPEDAEASGNQRWLFVRDWSFVGPFPTNHPTVVSWGLPEFFDNDCALYVTDIEALKRDGETCLPATRLVGWQKVEDQIEEGLQRPWTKRKPGGHGSVLGYSGPGNGITYAKTGIYAAKDVELWVGIGATDFGRVWVNDRLVAAAVSEVGAEERIAWGKAAFRKGRNSVVVRLDNAMKFVGSGAKRRPEQGALESHFWVKVAVRGKPLDAAAVKARQAVIAAKEATLRHVPATVQGYRNNNVAHYPDVKPVTAWDLDSGKNVVWRTPLELESAGGYGSNVNSSKAPPVIMGDRLIVLREPHFVCCLDKATGTVLWERECNVLEFTAPDKLDECRRLWAEYAQARAALQKLGRDHTEREATLMKQGMTKDEAKAEIRRVTGLVGERGGTAKKGNTEGFYGFLTQHGKFGRSAYGGWTGYSFASPVTDGERVWVKFGTGVAACFDREGNRRWMTPIPAEGETTVCPSPILAAGRFVVEVGAKSDRPGQDRFAWDWTRLIGLDAETGKEAWRTEPLFHPTATSSPVAMKLTNGREDMDVIVTDGGTVIRADDGKILSQTWLLDAGQGTPTVGGSVVYHPSEPGLLTASRPVMYDRDSAGLQRLWTQRLPTGFDGGMAFADGLLYGSGGGQGMGGYVVFDAVHRALLRYEWPGHGDRCTVWRGMPPQSNGRQYVPITVAGDYVFIGEHGSVFHGSVARGAICGVAQRNWDGLLLGKSMVEKAWVAPPVFEGDRIYVRTDPSIVCLGYTGNEGRAYEADVNARWMLGDLETQPPADTPPVDIAPVGAVTPNNASPFANFISFPVEVYGYFSISNADAVLAHLGGLSALPEPRAKPGTNAWDIAGETITRNTYPNCGMYGRSALVENLHFRDVPTGKGAYFRALLVNDRDRVVRVWASQEPPDVWIAGQRIPEGTRVRLKPGTYTLVGRTDHTEEWPVAPGFYFRLDDSADVAAERNGWQRSLLQAKPVLERIAQYGTRPAQVEKAKKLLSALSAEKQAAK